MRLYNYVIATTSVVAKEGVKEAKAPKLKNLRGRALLVYT